MVEFPSAYTRLSRSDILSLKDLAIYGVSSIHDNKKKFRTISGYFDRSDIYIPEEYIVLNMVKVPTLRNVEDKMPRFVKTLRPFIHHTINGGSIKNDSIRSVGRCYCADSLISYGYHTIDDSTGQKTILSNQMKIMYAYTDSTSDDIIPPIKQARELAYDVDGNDLTDNSEVIDYNNTDNLYFALMIKKSYMQNITESDIQSLIDNAPSYFVVRNELSMSPVKGFSKLDGTPLKLDSVTTQNVTIGGITTSTKVWNFKSYERVESGVAINDMLSYNGQTGILGFDATNFNNAGTDNEPSYPIGIVDGFYNGIVSRNADILMGRAGSTRKTNFFSALYQLVQAMKRKYLGSSVTTTDWAKYFSKLDYKVNYLKQLVESEALASSVSVYNGIKESTSYETDLTTEMTSFPDLLKIRTDLVIGFNVKEDSDVDFDNWQLDESSAKRYAVDINITDPDGAVYDDEAISQSVLNIIMTSLNERIFDKDFGTPLSALIFERANADLEALKLFISKKVTQYEPRVVCAENMIDIRFGGIGSHQLNIRVAFVIKANAKVALISKTIAL